MSKFNDSHWNPYYLSFPSTMGGMMKQVLLFRRDLHMRVGKIAAQVAHASMKVFLDRKLTVDPPDGMCGVMVIPLNAHMCNWLEGSFTKIVLSVESEADLVQAYMLAQEAGLPTALIEDSGRTEFHGIPTKTAVAIGPAPSEVIDKITGKGGLIPTRLA